ncbi:MAG: hypothetical protein WD876_01090 [Candidatus Pacearchaeota archaeon]
MQKAINAIVLRKEKVLLLKRNQIWVLPGAYYGEKDNPIDVFVREFRNEFNGADITVEKFYKKFIGKNYYTGDWFESHVYFARLKQPDFELISSSRDIFDVKFTSYFESTNGMHLSDIAGKVADSLRKNNFI